MPQPLVMAGQGGVSRVALAIATSENQRGDGLGIVPPDFAGDGSEELEGGGHAFENGLGAFERQSHDERGVGIGPDGHEKGHEPAAVGKVDMDVAEVGLHPPAGRMCQRHEGFSRFSPVRSHKASDLRIAAFVVMFLAQMPVDLSGCVPLFGRGGLVIQQDLPDQGFERPEQRSVPDPLLGQRVRFCLTEYFSNRVA